MKRDSTCRWVVRPARSPWVVVVAIGLVVLVGAVVWAMVAALGSGGTVGGGKAVGDARGAGVSQRAAGGVEVALEAAAVHHRDGRFAEASAILAKVSEEVPFDTRVRVALAQALVGMGEHARAYEQYEAAISIEQQHATSSAGSADAAMNNNPAMAQLHGEAGTCAMQAGLVDRAIEHYSAGQMADATNARYPLFLAMAQIRSGDDAAAMASLVRATLLRPDLAEAWGTMAELELKKNRVDLAAQHLERAIGLQPQQLKWRLVQARIFNRKGEPERALSALMALTPEERTSKPVLALIGESFGLLKRPAEAAALYESAARTTPTDAELWYQAALWHQRAGNTESSRKTASTAAMLGHEGARELVGVANVPATDDK